MDYKPRKIQGKWYIEVNTKEFGKVFLLDDSGYAIAIKFDSEKDALNHIEKQKLKMIQGKSESEGNCTMEKLGLNESIKEEITEENIDDHVDAWHESDSNLELYEYLGMSREQYAHWVETGKIEKVF